MEYVTSGTTLQKKMLKFFTGKKELTAIGNLDLHKRMESAGNKYTDKYKKMLKNLKKSNCLKQEF